MGEIFSLFGQIAIDYQDANKGLEQVSKQAGNTSGDLEGVDSAADSASDGLDSMGDTADSAGDDLDSLGDDAGSAGGDIDDMGGDADDASGDLDDLGSSASSAAGDIDDAASSADDAAGSFDDMAGSADSASGGLSGMDVASGSLAANGISSAISAVGGFVKDTVTAGDTVDKMSQKLGISNEAYQEWDYVCQICGTDVSKLQTGMKTLSGVITDAGNGSESANEKLAAVGLTLDDLNGLSQEEQLDLVVRSLQDMESSAERTDAACDLLGRSATDMAAVFNMTSDETDALKQKAHDLGIVMSDEAVSSSADLQDAMTTLQASFQGTAGELMSSLTPQLTAMFEKVTDCMPQIMSLVDALTPIVSLLFDVLIDDLLPILIDIVDFIASDVMPFIQNIIDLLEPILVPAIQLVMTIVQKAMSVIQPILNTLMSIISTLVSAVQNFSQVWSTVWGTVKSVCSSAVSSITSIISKISSTVSSICTAIGTAFSKAWSAVTNTVSKAVSSITNVISKIVSSVTNICSSIGSAFSNAFSKVTSTVSKAIEKIKGFFKFEVSLPKIKLPHFSITPKGWSLGDLLQGSIPSLGIEWYAKAMDDGMVMTQPTVFGVNGNGQLMAGGEAGSETVVGTQSLMNMITEAVNVQNEALVAEVDDMFNALFGRLDKYYPEMASTALVMDTGAVVGQLAPSMDTELGRIARRKSR